MVGVFHSSYVDKQAAKQIARKFYQEIPPRVEYSITDLGLTLDPILKSVCTWGTKHIAELQHARARYDRTAVKATPSGSS